MKKLLLTILSVIVFITPAFAITYDYDNYDYTKAPEYSNKEYMIPTSEIDSFKFESFKNGFLGLFGDEYSYVTIHLTAKGKDMLKKGTSKFKEMHILDNGVYEGGKCLDSKDITKPITDGIIHTSWLSDGKGAMSVAVNYNKALAYGGGVIIVFGELKYPPKEKVKETEPTTHREITLEKDSTKKVVEEEKVNETKSNVNSTNNNGSTVASLIKNAKCVTEYPNTTSINNIDSIKFGSFPQSSTNNEPIEWIVLEKDNDKALLMSKYCIVNSPYGNNMIEEGKFPWEKSDLRNYLNNDFYNTAFSSDEKSSILTNTFINTFKNDKVFIPSFNELDKYFKIFDVDWLQVWDGMVEDTMTAKDTKLELERNMGAQFKTEIKKLESIPTNNVSKSTSGGGKRFVVYDSEWEYVCPTYVSSTNIGTREGGGVFNTVRPLIWVSLK